MFALTSMLLDFNGDSHLCLVDLHIFHSINTVFANFLAETLDYITVAICHWKPNSSYYSAFFPIIDVIFNLCGMEYISNFPRQPRKDGRSNIRCLCVRK